MKQYPSVPPTLTKRRIRPKTYNETSDFHVLHSYDIAIWRKVLHSYAKPFKSWQHFGNCLLSFFPCLTCLRNYSLKTQLFGDIMAGLLAGVMNVTQGIAYAVLADLPAVNGLYTTFLCAFIYPIFSSWPHGSLGPFGLIELMSGTVAREVMISQSNFNKFNLTTTTYDNSLNPETIVSTLTFLNGIVCLVFGFLHLQFLLEYFSLSLVSGFITAVAIQVTLAQLNILLGVNVERISGIGYVYGEIIELYNQVPNINIVSVLMSLSTLIFLLLGKLVIQPCLRKQLMLKTLVVPWELIAVIVSIVITYYFELDTRYDLITVGHIPRDLPQPKLPRFDIVPQIFTQSVAISVCQIAFHMSVAKVMSTQKNYIVDQRQEIYAMGISLVITGFFPVFPGTNGLGRPFILDDAGGTSQIAVVVSGLFVLLVLYVAAPLLFWLPQCVLATIAIVAIRKLFRGFREVLGFWRMCRWDLLVWIVTFVGTMCINTIGGLIVGLLFQHFTLGARTQWPKWRARFSKRKDLLDVCIFEFYSMLVLTNGEKFCEAVRQAVSLWNSTGLGESYRTIIFDCSAITEIDMVGMYCFKQLIDELQRDATCGISFAALKNNVLKGLQKVGAINKHCNVFSTVEDAVWNAKMPTDMLPIIVKKNNDILKNNYKTHSDPMQPDFTSL